MAALSNGQQVSKQSETACLVRPHHITAHLLLMLQQPHHQIVIVLLPQREENGIIARPAGEVADVNPVAGQVLIAILRMAVAVFAAVRVNVPHVMVKVVGTYKIVE